MATRVQQVAEHLGVTPEVVKYALKGARHRMGCASTTGLVARYMEEMGR